MVGRSWRGGAALLALAAVAGCADQSATAPSPADRHAVHAQGTPTRSVFGALSAAVARVISTAMGEQPTVSPSVRIVAPSQFGATLRRNEPVTIRAAYRDFDYRPELRTPNAGATLGSQSQVVVDGVAQGHMHGYLQLIPQDGSMPSIESASFCVLERVVSRSGYDGIAEGDCPGVPPGDYRLSVEFQSNSHVTILKNGPRAAPTADIITVRVR
jgi:hypothetical protein